MESGRRKKGKRGKKLDLPFPLSEDNGGEKKKRGFWVRFSGDHHFSLQSFKEDHILRIKGVPSSSSYLIRTFADSTILLFFLGSRLFFFPLLLLSLMKIFCHSTEGRGRGERVFLGSSSSFSFFSLFPLPRDASRLEKLTRTRKNWLFFTNIKSKNLYTLIAFLK